MACVTPPQVGSRKGKLKVGWTEHRGTENTQRLGFFFFFWFRGNASEWDQIYRLKVCTSGHNPGLWRHKENKTEICNSYYIEKPAIYTLISHTQKALSKKPKIQVVAPIHQWVNKISIYMFTHPYLSKHRKHRQQRVYHKLLSSINIFTLTHQTKAMSASLASSNSLRQARVYSVQIWSSHFLIIILNCWKHL